MAHVELSGSMWSGGKYIELNHPAGVIWEADFSRLPLSTASNAASLRTELANRGLTLTRASAATVQTSASTVVASGIGVDDPRIGNAGYGQGLVIEESRQNYVIRSIELENVAWTYAGVTVPTANTETGPDGSLSAEKLTETAVTSVHANVSTNATLTAANYTGSMWLKDDTRRYAGVRWAQAGGHEVTVDMQAKSISASSGALSTHLVGAAGGWMRAGVTALGTASAANIQAFLSNSGGVYASYLGDISKQASAYGAQLEAGSFPTELILTTGAAATRATDLIVANDPARMIRSGRLGMECRFVPKGNSADHTGSPYVWWSDAGNNYAYWNATLGKFLVIIGGATAITSGAFSWSAGDVVDLWVEAGGGTSTIKARTNSGATQNLGTDATVRAAITGADLSLMGRGGAVLTSWLQRIRAYAPGRRPSWC